MTKRQSKQSDNQDLQELVTQLEGQKEKVLRAQADYQNLVRRHQQERATLIKVAGREVIEQILEPLDYLELAAQQIQDQGLNMVVDQFHQVLRQLGVEEIPCLGQEFNPELMEVVENKNLKTSSYVKTSEDKENKKSNQVIKVQRKGYRLNGVVVRHAQVIVK